MQLSGSVHPGWARSGGVAIAGATRHGLLSNSACGLRYSPVDLGNSVLEVLYSNGDIAAWVVSVYVQLADDFSQIQTDGLQRRDIFQADKHCLVPECGRG